ncbi:hypothetical protein ES703_42823 [subsurface metagenome]
MPDNNRLIQWRRQIRHNAVEQFLDSDIFQRRTYEHRMKLAAESGLSDCPFDDFAADWIIVNIQIHQLWVVLGRKLEHLMPLLSSNLLHILWDFNLFEGRSQRLGLIENRLHFYKVYDSLERILCSDGNLQYDRIGE